MGRKEEKPLLVSNQHTSVMTSAVHKLFLCLYYGLKVCIIIYKFCVCMCVYTYTYTHVFKPYSWDLNEGEAKINFKGRENKLLDKVRLWESSFCFGWGEWTWTSPGISFVGRWTWRMLCSATYSYVIITVYMAKDWYQINTFGEKQLLLLTSLVPGKVRNE